MGAAFSRKDLTAQGVAKIRLTESMFPAETRLFHDPYATKCVICSWVMELGGAENMKSLHDYGAFPDQLTTIFSTIIVPCRSPNRCRTL
jgi:O-methyltransferase involved in polyketide biosynthesis